MNSFPESGPSKPLDGTMPEGPFCLQLLAGALEGQEIADTKYDHLRPYLTDSISDVIGVSAVVLTCRIDECKFTCQSKNDQGIFSSVTPVGAGECLTQVKVQTEAPESTSPDNC